jgi:predicted dehydrogenase
MKSPLSTRRQFLERTGFALSTMSLAAPALAREQASGRKVRIGVVGGNFGCMFQFHEHPAVVVEAVSDLRPERRERLMQTYGCAKSYASLEELVLDREIEAVAIFTPAPDHVRHVCLALEAGKHVLCAVPAAMSLEECQKLVETVKRTGLTYMMAETSHYQQFTISARLFHREGKLGEVFYVESEYHHPGLEVLFFENGERTWRHGFPPLHYPTHCTAHLVSVTGERLTAVSALGWGDGDPIVKDNAYGNPFWNETAFFETNAGHAFRVAIYWRGAHRGCERAQWYGSKACFFAPHPNGLGALVVRTGSQTERDSGGFERQLSEFEAYEQPMWWQTDLLPEALRHDSGHEGSHTFLTHEFVDSLVHGRRPAIDVYEAVAYTAPGIVAHQSALQGGARLVIPSFDSV